MNCFWYYFTTKAKQCDIIRLRKVLETLAKTREGANLMKAYIKELIDFNIDSKHDDAPDSLTNCCIIAGLIPEKQKYSL